MRSDETIRSSDSQKTKTKKKQKKKIKQQKKKKKKKDDSAVPADHRIKLKKSEIRDKYVDLARHLTKLWSMKVDGDTNSNWNCRYNHQRICGGTGRHRNKRTSGDHLNYSIGEIGKSIKKSFGDLSRLVVTQTPVKNHPRTRVRKIFNK